MFQTFCQTLFHMTWTAAVAALVVMALRLALNRKVPRWVICGLWLVVFLRMVCPVSITLPVSLIPEEPQGLVPTVTGYVAEQRPVTEVNDFGTETTVLDEAGEPVMEPTETVRALDVYGVYFRVWVAGAAGMLLWAALSYDALRRRIADAVRVEGNIYETDQIDSPFVCGFFKPRIYLPVGLPEADRKYVLLHERAHIARLDHIDKPLAWLALSVHWFNPVLWLAFVLYSRDVETACDQEVIRRFDRADTAGYAAALLHLGRRGRGPQAVPLAFGEQDAKGRIRHVMDFKRPHILVVILAAAVCVAVGALLLANPGERSDQIDGVKMTRAQILDQGVPVDLPEHLAHEIILLIRQYDEEDFNDLDSYLPAPGDLVLSDQRGGTMFYLTSSLDRELVLVRTNHDRDGWASKRKGVTLKGLKDDLGYVRWRDQTDRYLTKGRADDLYLLKTAYIGNQVADWEILKALNFDEVVGPYTMELQTEEEPYGVTLHLSNLPGLESELTRNAQYLHQVGILFIALVDNASFFNWDYLVPGVGGEVQVLGSAGVQLGVQKPVTQGTFRMLYDAYREALGTLTDTPATGETTRYSLGEPLYLSPEMPWRDMPMYLGSVTVAKDLFSVQYAHALSSAMPEADSFANPVYRQTEAPDEIVLKDDAWPSQQYLELAQVQEPPLAADGVLPLEEFQLRSCLMVCDRKGEPTPYRLYRLDRTTWLSHETDGAADWVFCLTDQPGVPLPEDEAE